MPASIESVKARLQKLIANFDADQHHYLSKDYLEAEARIDFITPFFEALGWDVGKEAGLRHDEREASVAQGSLSKPCGLSSCAVELAGRSAMECAILGPVLRETARNFRSKTLRPPEGFGEAPHSPPLRRRHC